MLQTGMFHCEKRQQVAFDSTDLEKLDSNAGKHEIQQHGDQHDVADGFDGHKHTLDHMLSAHKQVTINA